MARIRTIKPDFWEDEAVAALSPLARLLFIGSWNLADDEGLLRWTPDYLNASLFMYDGLSPARVKKLMDEIEALGKVFVYSAGKTRQTLGYVVNFRKHQRINRPQPSRLPPPPLQNPLTCEMYARRDNWTCHICKGPINAKKVPRYDGYDNDRIDWIRENLGDDKFNFSPDHLIPRSKGGSDYPSNIGASHVSCNKGRGNRPLPGSLPDSLNEEVNDALPDSPPEGKGMEGEREVEVEVEHRSSSSLNGVGECPAEEEDRGPGPETLTAQHIAERRWRKLSDERRPPEGYRRDRWFETTTANLLTEEAGGALICEHLAAGTPVEAVVDLFEPPERPVAMEPRPTREQVPSPFDEVWDEAEQAWKTVRVGA